MYPDDEIILENLGQYFQARGQFKDALKVEKRAIKLMPNNALLLSNIATTHSALGQQSKAEQLFKKSIHLHSDNANTWNSYGAFLSSSGRLKEAEKAYRKAISLSSHWYAPHLNLAKVLIKQEKKKAAKKITAKVWQKRYEATFEDLIDFVAVLWSFGELERAEEAARLALDLQPQNPDALHLLGLIPGEQGKQSAFPQEYESRKPLVGKSSDSFVKVAKVLQDAKAFDYAKDCLMTALEMENLTDYSVTDVLYQIGVVSYRAKQYEEAEEFFVKSIQAGDNTEECWLDRACSLKDAGRLDESLEVVESYIKMNPESWHAWFDLGRIHTKRKDNPAAINAYKKAVEINPEYAEAWYNLGNRFAESKNLIESKRCYDKAVETRKSYARAISALGAIELGLNNILIAAKHFRRSFEIDRSDMLIVQNYRAFLNRTGNKDEAKKLDKLLETLVKTQRAAQ